jgi:hypothetical protein
MVEASLSSFLTNFVKSGKATSFQSSDKRWATKKTADCWLKHSADHQAKRTLHTKVGKGEIKYCSKREQNKL